MFLNCLFDVRNPSEWPQHAFYMVSLLTLVYNTVCYNQLQPPTTINCSFVQVLQFMR